MTPSEVLKSAGIRRTEYALAVAEGRRNLSGSDLHGLARKYMGRYHRTRMAIAAAWIQAGGYVTRGYQGKLALATSIPPGAKIGRPCAVSFVVWDLPLTAKD